MSYPKIKLFLQMNYIFLKYDCIYNNNFKNLVNIDFLITKGTYTIILYELKLSVSYIVVCSYIKILLV